MIRVAGAVALLAFVPRLALGQAATASLQVAVRDETGAGVPAAAVDLRGPGLAETATSDDRGRASFPHLRPGPYRLTATLAGFRTADLALEVLPGHRSDVPVVLRMGTAEALAEPPPPRGRSFDRATVFTPATLPLPRAADPWSVLRGVPGVVVDRVDVGGSETAQQSLLVSHGDAGSGATWTLDGIDVTDPAALGSSAVYPDMDALSHVEVRTGALDVRVRTPGVQVGLYLREPEDGVAGAVHLRGTGDALQSDNLSEELRSRTFLRNRTSRILELGAEAGGRVGDRRLWLWGAVARNALTQDTFTEHSESLRTTSVSVKARLVVGSGTLSLLAARSEKRHDDRDTGVGASPEARWAQSGPTAVVGAEDRRAVGRLSLLTRLSYLDERFRLEPQGGSGASVLEDFRGILRGSYSTLDTTRRRFQAGVEAATRTRWLGLDHDLLLGAGYRRSPVATTYQWPGNQVLGFERQSVFFRTFRLTGFALPTRDQDGRSVQGQIEAYAQDSVRTGRLAFTLGLRLDRISGHNRASSVEANPVFPELLPAVAYAGDPARFRWLDVLPRAGVAWDVAGDGGAVVRASYAAYAAPLGSGDVTFDNPIGRDYASLTYYWIDRNGNHVVDAGELDGLRGLLGSSGLDPDARASTLSPNRIDPDLRSPRTHEVRASLEESFGNALTAGLHASFRRTLHPLWRPLRGLSLADYVIRGGVRGQLFGEQYNVGFFAPASESRIVPGNGRILSNRDGYHQDALTLEATAEGRIGPRVRWAVSGAFIDWRESFDDARAFQDPTPLDNEPLDDRGPVAVRPGGLGRSDVFVNARWNASASLRATLPWKLDAAAHVHARDGFPIPYFEVASTGDPTAGAKNVLIAPRLDTYRLSSLVLVDLRLARGFSLRGGTLTASADVFNLLNRGTTLQVARDVELPAFDRPREILRPRIVRFGVEYRFHTVPPRRP